MLPLYAVDIWLIIIFFLLSLHSSRSNAGFIFTEEEIFILRVQASFKRFLPPTLSPSWGQREARELAGQARC